MKHFFTALLSLCLALSAFASVVVNDVTQINPIKMKAVLTPHSIDEVQRYIRESTGPISIGGGRYSMGGQTAIDDGVQLDMREMNKVVSIDAVAKTITVQSGIRWRDIQDAIDPLNLSVKIMQTYSNFTVGGSLSVNVHGRYIGEGPLIRSVLGIKVVLPDGSLVVATPTANAEIFYGAIGGYGGIGVIVEATLQLTDNIKIKRHVELVKREDYLRFFRTSIRDNKDVVLHNGDLYPPDFEEVRAVTWKKTDEPLTVQDRLIPRNQKYVVQPKALSIISSIPMGKTIRSSLIDPILYRENLVVWKNYEASYDVAELEPESRAKYTYVLQEYFIPVARFDEFVPKMRRIFDAHKVNVLNVSIRHALPDPGSLLAWASEEVFCFVVYIKQEVTPEARVATGNWTRAMQDEILATGGRWYLPYQIHATDSQFQRAYPRFLDYYHLKQRVDPDYRLKNKLIERYYTPLPKPIAAKLRETKDYRRGEDQSFLSLPEWYIVFNSDEYAKFLQGHRPSGFPYWQSTKEYWSLYSQAMALTEGIYPSNFGYKFMLWVIGSSYSAELLIKGAWENTVGRLTEALTSDAGTAEDRLIASYHAAYGDFIHVRPWFEFSFWDRVKDLWSKADVFGENFIRKIERRCFFTFEYGFKAIYASVIGFGSSSTYGAEPERIYMVAQGPGVTASPQVKDVLAVGDVHLISTPRYDVLRELLKTLDPELFRILEIAGNRKILFTTVGPRKNRPESYGEAVVGVSRVVTDDEAERLLVAVPVGSLVAQLQEAQRVGLTVEHVFDY